MKKLVIFPTQQKIIFNQKSQSFLEDFKEMEQNHKSNLIKLKTSKIKIQK